ncbi:MAG: hypothetical protein C4527_11430 [Candidatus Omnitrophota bacterium]|jgi:hypothetical protein|nr:MAG: hypothetical protein C4527_11430 [Candidatus Omnitrophota bacterium]
MIDFSLRGFILFYFRNRIMAEAKQQWNPFGGIPTIITTIISPFLWKRIHKILIFKKSGAFPGIFGFEMGKWIQTPL